MNQDLKHAINLINRSLQAIDLFAEDTKDEKVHEYLDDSTVALNAVLDNLVSVALSVEINTILEPKIVEPDTILTSDLNMGFRLRSADGTTSYSPDLERLEKLFEINKANGNLRFPEVFHPKTLLIKDGTAETLPAYWGLAPFFTGVSQKGGQR